MPFNVIYKKKNMNASRHSNLDPSIPPKKKMKMHRYSEIDKKTDRSKDWKVSRACRVSGKNRFLQERKEHKYG